MVGAPSIDLQNEGYFFSTANSQQIVLTNAIQETISLQNFVKLI